MAQGRSRAEEGPWPHPLGIDFMGTAVMWGDRDEGAELDPTRDLRPGSPQEDVRRRGPLMCSAGSHRLS